MRTVLKDIDQILAANTNDIVKGDYCLIFEKIDIDQLLEHTKTCA